MDESAPIVEPAIPRFLGTLDTKGERATRLDLANWLVSHATIRSPRARSSTARGASSSAPGCRRCSTISDRRASGRRILELLDWLAAEFMHPEFDAQSAHDWDVKHIIRLIVTSHTYRQSSLADAGAGRARIRRTACSRVRTASASMPRSCAMSRLHVSGLLSDKFGGPSVKPVSSRTAISPR